MARPSEFSKEVVTLICERMQAGETLSAICKDEDLPAKNTVLRWLDRHTEFQNQYARARTALMDHYADQMVEIAFEGSNADHVAVARDRLKVDTLKWIMSKLGHRKYGDKLAIDASGQHHGITEIKRVIIGWEKPEVIPPEPAKQITYDPGPLPARLDPDVLHRLVRVIKSCVPMADQRPGNEALEEVLGVTERALRAHYKTTDKHHTENPHEKPVQQ